jgi:hypothetical protein
MWRKKIHDKVGYFDETFYPAYFEDNDYYWRMCLANEPIIQASTELFEHGKDGKWSCTLNSGDENLRKKIQTGCDSNYHYFVAKWGGEPRKEVFTTPFDSGVSNIKKNVYIIPTIGREGIAKAINSINEVDRNAVIMIGGAGTPAQNRNKCLNSIQDCDWVFFVDDDNWLENNWLEELDDEYDVIILRMWHEDRVLPQTTKVEDIAEGQVGSNFCYKWEKFKDIRQTDPSPSEDWRMIKEMLDRGAKVKITSKVYYQAPVKGWSTVKK